MTTFRSYGAVEADRQAAIIQGLGAVSREEGNPLQDLLHAANRLVGANGDISGRSA